mgnify:CR=1 FL=1
MRKLNNTDRKDRILKLRAKGKSYREIQSILGCSKSTISYHCGNGNEKKRVKNDIKKRKPICKKVSSFKTRCSRANYKLFRAKVKTFKRRSKSKGNKTNTIVNSISRNYSCQDVIDKFGNNLLLETLKGSLLLSCISQPPVVPDDVAFNIMNEGFMPV